MAFADRLHHKSLIRRKIMYLLISTHKSSAEQSVYRACAQSTPIFLGIGVSSVYGIDARGNTPFNPNKQGDPRVNLISSQRTYSPFRPHISPSSDMSDHSAPSHLKLLFEAALEGYETQTGMPLPQHPLAERLQECHSVESITTVLHEQIQAFNQFRGKEKLIKSLRNAISILHNLSACAKLGEVIGLVHLKALMRNFIPLTLVP